MSEDELLDKVVETWAEAGKLRDEADESESHARDLRYQSEDKLDEADALARPLIDLHPEWKDAIDMQRDPRA